ncbi:MAG: SPOR domain-containing protein [Rhodospirillales bacterium]|nr:SPOR domain-containing protein [Rhodospirillales bacterium]
MALSANSDMKVSSADKEYDGDGDTAKSGSSGMLKLLAVLVCVTLILGGVWIGFGERIMAMFGPSDGDVPVIAADPAPIKVRPENPGGMQVPNQGRLVYGVVDGSSTQPRVERLLPSPEKPVAVDEVLKRGVPEASEVVTSAAPRGTADSDPNAPMRLTPGGTEQTPESLSKVPSAETVSKLSAAPAPAPEPVKDPDAERKRIAQEMAASVSRDVTNTSNGSTTPAPPPVPVAKPEPKPVPEAKPASEPKQVANAAPAPESPGADIGNSWRVQLAASRSEPAVKSEWDRLRSRNVDLLGDLRLQVTRVDLGATKGIFYRLRAGPLADETTAKALCERLKQRKLGCLVVKPGV